MAELRRITKGELQLNVIALMYNVSLAEVERLYREATAGKKGEKECENDLPTGRTGRNPYDIRR